jgi:uncharacterized membrane protein
VLSHPDVGAFLYRVDATPLPGEKRTNDNSYALSVQVTDSRNRLLYVEVVPRWESKYLTRNLIANPDVSPLSFVRGPGGAFISYGQRGGMTLDLTRDQLLRFKMIILGDLDAATLTDTRATELLTFVDEGGSLILLGGPRAWGAQGFGVSPLAKLLPVKRTGYAPVMEGQFKVSITPEGLSHPAFQRQEGAEPVLPHLLSVFPGSAPTAGATVLAVADTPQGAQPVIIAQRYGQGKVAAVLTDSLWRWALAGGSDKPYARFWRQLVNWMTPQQQDADQWGLELTADRERLFDGESLTMNAKLFGMDGLKDLSSIRMHCEVTRPDGKVLSYTMDRAAVTGAAAQVTFTLPFTPDQGGLFRAVAKTELDGRRMESGPYAFFLNPYSPETEPKAADVELLRTISSSSQGRFCATQEDLAAALQALEHEGIDEERVRFVSLWNTWVVMALILLALVTEWFWRQKRNLV